MKIGKTQVFSCDYTGIVSLLALFWGLGYELRGTSKEGAEQLEPHIQSIFHWLFSR
jgi:hypothetical protein